MNRVCVLTVGGNFNFEIRNSALLNILTIFSLLHVDLLTLCLELDCMCIESVCWILPNSSMTLKHWYKKQWQCAEQQKNAQQSILISYQNQSCYLLDPCSWSEFHCLFWEKMLVWNRKVTKVQTKSLNKLLKSLTNLHVAELHFLGFSGDRCLIELS